MMMSFPIARSCMLQGVSSSLCVRCVFFTSHSEMYCDVISCWIEIEYNSQQQSKENTLSDCLIGIMLEVMRKYPNFTKMYLVAQ